MRRSEWLQMFNVSRLCKEIKCILKNHDQFIQQKEFTDTSSSPSSSVSDDEDLEDAAYQQEDQQSFAESLNEPEVPGLWDWDSKMPRVTLINHVPVTAVTSTTFNELVAYFKTDKFPTQSPKPVRSWRKVLPSQPSVQKEPTTVREHHRPEQRKLSVSFSLWFVCSVYCIRMLRRTDQRSHPVSDFFCVFGSIAVVTGIAADR